MNDAPSHPLAVNWLVGWSPQVVPTWLNGATTPNYFISFRDNYQWDSFLLSQYLGGCVPRERCTLPSAHASPC